MTEAMPQGDPVADAAVDNPEALKKASDAAAAAAAAADDADVELELAVGGNGGDDDAAAGEANAEAAEAMCPGGGGGGGSLSPLSGAYLLVVLGEPLSEEHKEKMLQKLKQGKSVERERIR